MKLDAPQSILVVKLSALGDVIHTLPALQRLREAFPNARIGWVCEELSAPLLMDHPAIDTLYVIPKKRWQKFSLRLLRKEMIPFFKQIRAGNWDVSIDFQGLTKSGIYALISGATIRIGHAGEAARELSLLCNNRRVYTRRSDDHVVLENLRLLSALGVDPAPAPAGIIAIPEDVQKRVDGALEECGWKGQPLVTLNIGAGWSSKRYPERFFGILGKKLYEAGYGSPLLLWAPSEERRRDQIAAAMNGTPYLIAPPTSILEIAAVAVRSSLFVGGDTGPSHMAAMVGTPTVAIFGASDPIRNGPWPRHRTLTIARGDLACRPCWKRECPLHGDDNLACLRTLTPDLIMERIALWLASRSSS